MDGQRRWAVDGSGGGRGGGARAVALRGFGLCVWVDDKCTRWSFEEARGGRLGRRELLVL